MSVTPHPWLPKASCDAACMHAGAAPKGSRPAVWARSAVRITGAVLLLLAVPVLAVPLPGRSHLQRGYCRLMLRCVGVRITVSGGPIRNLRGVLVVSGHVSWLDVFTIGAVLPGSFVARADLIDWPALGVIARLMKVIPIERENLRRLPAVVGAVAARLRNGQTVVAFPEGTTWCGLGHGPFRPAMFQAAVDAGRPVQPLRLTYHHRDGRLSTVPAYVGEDTLVDSIRRLVTARRTVAHVQVQSLQLPGDDRRDLTARCEAAVRGAGGRDVAHAGQAPALVA
ncbi:lysophospholipid acyltransferase family protein [Mycolicibacterium diernhoferi]|uniref:1-acyl-sn-glycerol-3-phosphate acyltransferase n=1 Tax=Mycolicibacterium diernhoferi TaxID=1801 RepID=A0A1Q4HG51_9MYCO|nr:lysophospholipid acyltransferase family protein [Mycolicibacterium diernhoferi]OJZ66465.1 1-acyl-sn-glycerol-3-phosphate acyltransferase [Mycolicibacterium diernhoferi]OPE44800.1 1-acyl-sn-glycerol-3-phosphate acyltransferase [Mycolicibacterium diernhoferi]PEG56341.1 1-acyl-sn-glycerol-3-phosphate acyltransferase [Mycolicibacterium diernhoferi]QYL24640.1 1-acyl-sn-glycerol-3-phosphate acyltransferase [Mycolicibacterium diernhoferi]